MIQQQINSNIKPLYEEELKASILQTSKEINQTFQRKDFGILASLEGVDLPVFIRRQEDLLVKHQAHNKERILTDILFAASDRAEQQCPNSGTYAMYLCSLLNEHQIGFSDSEYQEIKSILRNHIKKCDKQELIQAIHNVYQNSKHLDMVLDACFLSGPEGRITTSINQYSQPTIAYHMGYNFPVKPAHEIFMRLFGSSIPNPNILVYDGKVINSSELHLIIYHANKTKEPVVVFAHGFSERVVYDMIQNCQKGAIQILPVVIPREAENLNALYDIAMVSGAEVIAPHKGDVLGSTSWTKLVKVERIKLRPESITLLTDNKTKASVMKKLATLIESQTEEDLEIMQDSINERIKSLTFKTVEISLPEFGKTHLEIQNDFIDIDQILKMVQKTISFGIIHNKQLFEDIQKSDKINQGLKDVLQRFCDYMISNKDIEIVPSLMFISAIRNAYSTYTLIYNASVAVLLDD